MRRERAPARLMSEGSQQPPEEELPWPGLAPPMEPPLGKALTPQEKEKLKEKLALLKREYSKTLNRLQRAERAEKLKNDVKKAVAEQNELLMQEEEPISQMSPERVPAGSFSELSAAEMPSVTLNLEPEVLGPEGSLPEDSAFEATSQGLRKALFSPVGPVPAEKPRLLSRSRFKLRRRATLAVEENGESCCEVLPRNAERQLGCRAARDEDSASPVFKRRGSILVSEQSTPKTPPVATAGGGSGSEIAPPEPPLETSGDATCPEISGLLPCFLPHKTQEPWLEHLCKDGTLASSGGSAAENREMQNKETESVQTEEGQACVGEEEEEEVRRTADAAEAGEAFRGGGSAPPGSGTPKENSQCEDTQSSGLGDGDASTSRPEGEALGSQVEAGSLVLEGALSAVPTESPLSSCTVVEGLLFPVEYYVRTTRRMSSCQREVNLAAVIQSQLGKGRRAPRTAQRERDAGPAESGEELKTVRPPPPDVDTGTGDGGSSPGRSLPRSHKGAASAGEPAQSRGLPQGRRRRGRPRGRPRRRATAPKSQDLLEDSEPAVPQDHCRLVSNGAQENSQGEGAVLPVPASGNVEGEQSSGKGLFASRRLRAELGSPPSSSAVGPGAELASGSVGGQEDGSKGCRPRRRLREQGGAELGPPDTASLPQDEPPGAALKRKAGRASQGRKGAASRASGSPGCPASLGLFWAGGATSALPFHAENETACPKWLRSKLDLQEFHLPEEEFGLLKSQKLKACAAKPLESFDVGKSAGRLQLAPEAALEEAPAAGGSLDAVLDSLQRELPEVPPLPQCLHEEGASSLELLRSPGASGLQVSQLPTPDFPVVGATPAPQALPKAFCASPLPAKANPTDEPGPSAEASALASGSREEPSCGTGVSQPQSHAGTSWKSEDEAAAAAAVSLKEQQLPAGKSVEPCKESPQQSEGAPEGPAEAPDRSQRDGNLQMTSKLKNCSGSCSVDVSTVWWEVAGITELCVVTACETSVTLWRHLDPGHWGALHTWPFAEVPVLQLVTLPGVTSLLCVALGGLEIAEVRFLSSSSDDDGCLRQSLVKAGNINAVLGLKNRRVATSCGSLQNQEVEVASFSELGRSMESRALMPPEETILAFAEVDGMQEALVGMTTTNCVLVWNLKTGQLLRKMPVGGCSYPAPVCHKAYSDSGLLFVVLSHPHAKEGEPCGNPAFQVVALNPRTARSTAVMFLPLPRGIAGRYLEGEVRDASAAAVLTSGAIAVWDLCLGQCTALLPPKAEGSWSLVRWSVTDACLLAGQKDGSVYVYSYAGRLPPSREPDPLGREAARTI